MRPASHPEDGKALAIVPDQEDGTQRIRLSGELDVSTVPEFNKRTGLSAILVAEMHARMRGQRFSVIEGPPHVNELFRLTGVDNFLEIVSRPGANSG